MKAQRTEIVSGSDGVEYKVEEFYWAGEYITYINNRKTDMTFIQALGGAAIGMVKTKEAQDDPKTEGS